LVTGKFEVYDLEFNITQNILLLLLLLLLLITTAANNYNVFLSIYLFVSPQPSVGPWQLFQSLDLFIQTVRSLGRGISPSQGTTQTQNKRTQISMPQMRFEPTIPLFERAKTVHALDRAATVTGNTNPTTNRNNREIK
jgi:hypothetical protein